MASSEGNKSKSEIQLLDDKENNYLRLANILFKIAPPAVREYFDKEFYPGGLQTVLNQNRFKILQTLKNKRVVNQKQWDLLFPKSGVASSQSFDLTLMICLIRNLTKTNISDDLPLDADESIGASLSTIKFYRNNISHSDHKTMCYEEFHKQWSAITKAIVRIGGKSYEKVCNDLQNYKLDKEILVEMQNMALPSNPIPRGLQDIIDDKINQWRTSLDKVIKTKAMTSLINLLEDNDLVVVTGPSGCGKTTAVHFTSIWLHDQAGHDIIPAHFPTDLTQYYNPERKQVFVYDDVCGKYSIDLQMVKTWNTLTDDILKIKGQKKMKVIMSCKTHIFLHKMFQSLRLPLASIDLLSAKYALSNEEKDLIAQLYLSQSQIQSLKSIKNLSQYDCFPLLCRLYPSSNTDDVVKFFSSPVQVIKDDLLSLLQDENDQTTIATLALFVLLNNCITEENLRPRCSKIRFILDHLSDTCITMQTLSLPVIKRQLESLVNSYVKKTRGKYSIIHDKVFDILSSFFGEHMFDLLLEHSRPEFVRDRFVLQSVNETADECIITVPIRKETIYFDRLYKDIIEGHSFCVFRNRQLQYDIYRVKFIENINRRFKSDEGFTLSTDASPLLDSASKGHNDIVEMLLSFNLDVNDCDNKGRTSLYLASEGGHFETVKLLLMHNADRNICRTDYWQKGESPLYVAASKGYLDIVKSLFINKHDCSKSRQDDFYKGRTPLHEASENGHALVIDFFIKMNCDVNIINENNESPLWLASKKGYIKVVELLLGNGAKPNLHTKKNGTPLCIASWYGRTDVVKVLLEYKADPHIGNYKKCTPIHLAAREGHAEIVSILLERGVNPNKSRFHFSPLYLAVTNNRLDVVKLLLTKGNADPDIINPDSKSPVYIAAKNGYIDIVQLLIQNKADVNICDLQNRSPLFVAASRGWTEIVNLLLSVNARPNIKAKDGENAISIAKKNDHDDIFKILSNYQRPNRKLQLNTCTMNVNSTTVTLYREHQMSTQNNRLNMKCCTVS